jgi:hypothetical protein
MHRPANTVLSCGVVPGGMTSGMTGGAPCSLPCHPEDLPARRSSLGHAWGTLARRGARSIDGRDRIGSGSPVPLHFAVAIGEWPSPG